MLNTVCGFGGDGYLSSPNTFSKGLSWKKLVGS